MTKEKVKYTLEIVQDEYGESPDSWGNTDLFLVYSHRQFDVKRKGFDPEDIFSHLNAKREIEKSLTTINNKYTVEEYSEDLNPEYEKYWIFGVDAYIHSGVHLSLANTANYPDRQWDVSTTGYILVDKEIYSNIELDVTIKSKYPEEEDKARYYAEGLIETWNSYLSGEVYMYYIQKHTKCDCCEHIEKETVDSCGGFYTKEDCENEGDYSLKILNKEE